MRPHFLTVTSITDRIENFVNRIRSSLSIGVSYACRTTSPTFCIAFDLGVSVQFASASLPDPRGCRLKSAASWNCAARGPLHPLWEKSAAVRAAQAVQTQAGARHRTRPERQEKKLVAKKEVDKAAPSTRRQKDVPRTRSATSVRNFRSASALLNSTLGRLHSVPEFGRRWSSGTGVTTTLRCLQIRRMMHKTAKL